MSTQRSQLYCDETLPLSLCLEDPGPLRYPPLPEWSTLFDQQLVYTGSLAELFCESNWTKVENAESSELPGTPVADEKRMACAKANDSPPALASAAQCTPTRRKKTFKRKRLPVQEPLEFTRLVGDSVVVSVTPVV